MSTEIEQTSTEEITPKKTRKVKMALPQTDDDPSIDISLARAIETSDVKEAFERLKRNMRFQENVINDTIRLNRKDFKVLEEYFEYEKVSQMLTRVLKIEGTLLAYRSKVGQVNPRGNCEPETLRALDALGKIRYV